MGSRGSLNGGIVGASLGSTADSDGFQHAGMGKTILPSGYRARKSELDTTRRPFQSAEALEVTGKGGSISSTMRRPAAVTLPALPPAFSRPLSPGSQAQPSERLQQQLLQKQAAQTWHPSPSDSDDSPMADTQSPMQSSKASRPGVSRRPIWTGGGDPLLRIVPLGQWLKELGIVNDPPGASLPGAPHQQDSASPDSLLVSGRSWLGLITDSTNHAQRAKLDRAFVEHLALLAKSRFLPLDEVAEDLQIWRLKLHDRAARKRLTDLFGRNLLRRQGFQDDLFLRRGAGNDDQLAGKGADGSNRHSSWNPDDYFADSSDGGGGGGGRSGGGVGPAYHKPPPKALQRTGDTEGTDGATAGGDYDENSQAKKINQSDIDDEEKKRRRRAQEEDEDEEARKRRLAEEEAQRKKTQQTEGQAAQDDSGPQSKGRESNMDLGTHAVKKASTEAVEEEPLPRGLFRIKDYGPRPATEELSLRTLFPRVKVRKERGVGSDEEDEEDEEEVEMPRPPATAPARRPIRGNLAEEFREAVRIAWERAFEEVEAAWEAQSGGPRCRSVRLEGEEALALGSTENSLDDPLDINNLVMSDHITSESEVSDAPEEFEDLLKPTEPLSPSAHLHGDKEGDRERENENLDDEASGNRTPDGLLDGMARTDDLSESRKRLHRQRYGRRLQARTRDSAARNRARQCWMQRVESCRRSLGSLTALGTFAEGATGALRDTVDRIS